MRLQSSPGLVGSHFSMCRRLSLNTDRSPTAVEMAVGDCASGAEWRHAHVSTVTMATTTTARMVEPSQITMQSECGSSRFSSRGRAPIKCHSGVAARAALMTADSVPAPTRALRHRRLTRACSCCAASAQPARACRAAVMTIRPSSACSSTSPARPACSSRGLGIRTPCESPIAQVPVGNRPREEVSA